MILVYKELSKPIVAAVESYAATRNASHNTNSTSNARISYKVNPKMKEVQQHYKEKMKEFMQQYDMWILPVASTLAFAHNPQHKPVSIQTDLLQQASTKQIHYWKNISYCTPISVLGNPVLTAPIAMDTTEHLPIGIQCVGNLHSENDLISIIQQFTKQGLIKLLPEPSIQTKSHY